MPTMTEPFIKEITQTIGRTTYVVWYQYRNGDRFQRISGAFALDGKEWEPGTFLMKRANAKYAVAMSPEEWSRDQHERQEWDKSHTL